MFDFSFAELALIVVVAVLFIGPKELPVVVAAVGKALRHIRALTREIRGVFDDIVKESGVDELKHDVQMIKGDDGKMYEAYKIPKKGDDQMTRDQIT